MLLNTVTIIIKALHRKLKVVQGELWQVRKVLFFRHHNKGRWYQGAILTIIEGDKLGSRQHNSQQHFAQKTSTSVTQITLTNRGKQFQHSQKIPFLFILFLFIFWIIISYISLQWANVLKYIIRNNRKIVRYNRLLYSVICFI